MPSRLPPSQLHLSPRSADESDVQLVSSSTTNSRTPSQLAGAVPKCARSCLRNYIQQQYDQTCISSDCLCGRYSTESYSLGELALMCVKGPDCAEADLDDLSVSNTAYSLCWQERDAVPGLHTTLTVPEPSRPGTSSTATSTSLRKATTTSAQEATTTASNTLTTAVIASTTASNTSTSTPNTTSAAPVTSSSVNTLTSAQAVGVSIGAVSGVLMIVGIIFVMACLRRRKARMERAQSNSCDFVDEAPTKCSTSTHGYGDPRGPSSDFHAPRAKQLSEKHTTTWPSQNYASQQYALGQSDYRNQSLNQGRARSPESIRSNTSMRTVSQLLPERPGSKPPPAPPSKSPIYASVAHTPATVFEEERNPTPPRIPLAGLPAHPAVMKAWQPRAYEGMAQPALTLQIPRQPVQAPDMHSMVDWPLRPPPVLTAPYNEDRLSGRSGTFSSKTSLLDYYASADSGASPQDLNSATPIEEVTQVRRPAPTPTVDTQPSSQPRAVRDSVASDVSRRTSFESTNPDETTPPEEDDKRLSPVVESPISHVRYPRIPRSSNQAIPRSPVYSGAASQYPVRFMSTAATPGVQQKWKGHTPTLSGSTLAAKRRGDTAAHDREKGLCIANSSYNSHSRKNSKSPEHTRRDRAQRQESPLKGYGRSTTHQPHQAPRHPLTIEMKSPDSRKSPLWEPKMTPTRKGDDLYLSVSVATPHESHFHDLYDRQ